MLQGAQTFRRDFGIPFALFALALMFIARPANATTYSVLDLGYLGNGAGHVSPEGYNTLNNLGQVVGYTVDERMIRRAFRTQPNAPMTSASNLATPDQMESAAFSINDAGQTAAFAYFAGQSGYRALGMSPGSTIVSDPSANLGTLGGYASKAYGINNSGQVVGYSYIAPDDGLTQHAFRTAANAPINAGTDDLGTLGGRDSQAYAVNASGQAVGSSDTSSGSPHAFRTGANLAINPATDDLGTLGGHGSIAYAINASGQTVGYSTDKTGAAQHAFRTTATGKISDPGADLGTLGGKNSQALSINSLGQVVGFSDFDPRFTAHKAFFADANGPMQDLNDLISANSGWSLQEAHGINDLGQIAGIGFFTGHASGYHAFLLTPVPEPGIGILSTFAGIALLRRRRDGGRY